MSAPAGCLRSISSSTDDHAIMVEQAASSGSVNHVQERLMLMLQMLQFKQQSLLLCSCMVGIIRPCCCNSFAPAACTFSFKAAIKAA